MTQQPQRPEKEFRVGNIEATIWRNETEQDGRTVVRHSVTFNKRFYDKQADEWRDTNTYFPNDLPKLRLAIDEAYRFIVLRAGDQPDAGAGDDVA